MFIWLGLVWLARFDLSVGLFGVGVITLGAQAVRRNGGLLVQGFWLVVGTLFLVGGVWGLLEVGLPLAPLVLIVAGLVVVLCAFRPSSRRKRS